MSKRLAISALLGLIGLTLAAPGAQAAGVDRLYVLNCGEGMAGDVSRWTPGAEAGKPMAFVDNCYLVHHDQGWLLWDTGVADEVAAMPDGLAPPDPRAVRWRRPKTLAGQLQEIGVAPADIKFVAVSHTHPDHSGNVEMVPQAMLLVQRAEYDWPGANGAQRFKPSHPVTKLDGDHDVFGDGSAVILSTPGHTPGHQSLEVKLPKTGAVVLSGDVAHFKSNFDGRIVPPFNENKEKSLASMNRVADIMSRDKAQLWINHDKVQRDTLKMSPGYYE